MTAESVEVLVVGAGQAGLAMSEHLSKNNVPHLVLERHRIAERWRSERWDSMVANGPAWHDRFPGMEFSSCGPDGFPHKEAIADYFVDYAKMIDAPIRCGEEVLEVRRHSDGPGFHVRTAERELNANYIVAATGAFQNPVFPAMVPTSSAIKQIHSSAYHNPDQLPQGAVMVIGAGSSGTQIAEELLTSGRTVYLSVGSHDRPPRRYRGRDFVWWLGVLGKWDIQAAAPGVKHVTIAVSGANGGRTVDFRRLAREGMTLVGETESCENGVLSFAPNLAENIAKGDANYLSLLDEADAYIARNNLDLPEEPEARDIEADPPCVTDPVLELNMAEAGITSIIWATGYSVDFNWLKVDTFDENGRPRHQRGVSAERGVYFLGLPWLSGRASSFIWGVWHDARYLADHIATQRSYLDYDQDARTRAQKAP